MNKDTVKYLLDDPKRLFSLLGSKGLFNFLSDEQYIQIRFRLAAGYWPNIKNPKTFNEKLQWLKLYARKPLYTSLVDKYAVREYVADKIGEEYLVPLVGGPWKTVDEIDFNALPDQFVLKCNHDSGGLVVCRDKSKLDIEEAKRFLNKRLKRNYYYVNRERPYKDIIPCIIAEQYMQDGDKENLGVYKIMCFNGEPKIFQTIQNDKTKYESIDYFDTQWNLLPMKQDFDNSQFPMDKPGNLAEMLEIAGKLSCGFPFLRTDLYSVNGRVYFSELTLYSDCGWGYFDPPEWDDKLGSWLELPNNYA